MTNARDTIIRSGPLERAYLLDRAEAHRGLADVAQEPGARMIHLRLDQLYRARADDLA